jgi:glutamate synthase (NADPH) small chain
MNEQPNPENILVSTDPVDRKWIDVNIPCKAACPIMTDIPGYIQAVMEGDYEKAYLINRMDNVLPGVLGRICNRPCEKACRHGRDGLGDPVSICFLKRSAADYGFKDFAHQVVPNGKKICVIGAGPSGLTAANDLAIRGYSVTMLEQFSEPGGMLRYGIPEYRLPFDILEKDVKSILDLGVELKTSVCINKKEQVEDLSRDYDAVIIAGGCMLPKKASIPGTDAEGFCSGLEFMMKANTDQFKKDLNGVIVVGGGFTSVDCCRMAYRLGAKQITLTFVLTKEQLTVSLHEVEAMEAENIRIEFLASPVAVEVKDDKLVGLKMVRNSIIQGRTFAAIPGSEFILPADTAVFAIGQTQADFPDWENNGKFRNIFITGDFRNGASTVIEAAADGRKIGREVHQFLSEISGYQEVVSIKNIKDTGRIRDYDFIPRQPMDEISLPERIAKRKEVETGFSREKSLIEARRCYLCHYNFQIDIDRCIYCLKCIDVMPVDCIRMVKEIELADDGSLNYIETKLWSETRAIAIDNDKCIRCGNCYRACPVDCISISKYELEIKDLRRFSP